MIHDLTGKQLQTLRWLVVQIRNGDIEESFKIGVSHLFGSREIVMLNGRDRSKYLDSGVLSALVAEGILVHNPSINEKYTIRNRAYEIIDFDFDNPKPSPISSYIKQTYPLIKARFDLPEFEELCFDLDVDPDRDIENMKNRELELLRHLYHLGQLQKLILSLKKFRPNYDDWLPYPGN